MHLQCGSMTMFAFLKTLVAGLPSFESYFKLLSGINRTTLLKLRRSYTALGQQRPADSDFFLIYFSSYFPSLGLSLFPPLIVFARPRLSLSA